MAPAHQSPPDGSAAFARRTPGKRGSLSLAAPQRPSIQPHLMAAAMTMGGWASWELIHFIGEATAAQDGG